jgi:hypothetical protein
MELTPKRKTKKPAAQEPQQQWRLRAPVSKADKDAIRAFQRAVNSAEWMAKQLHEARKKVQHDFEVLQKRGQIEAVVPVTSTAGPVEEIAADTTGTSI